MKTGGFGRGALLAAAAMGGLCYPQMASAQEARQQYDVEAPSLADALRELSRQTGIEVIFASDAVAGKTARPLHGTFTSRQAIDRILDGSGLHAEFRDGGYIVRGRAAASNEGQDRSTSDDIVVTGSHIRGNVPASTVIALSQGEIRHSGYSNLADAVRAIPQNFTGGQNPGIAGGGNQGNQQNVTSSTTLNLRGIGGDATLTLLNGHRMPYDGLYQGIDISSIPLAALDRIEIVADGSSAIYGSDAVGGVANVILRDSFDGAQASAKYGTTTDGGYEQQQYDIVAGKSFSRTKLMGAATYSKSTGIYARDRTYTSSLNGSQTLYPSIKQISGLINGSQEIGDRIRLSIDGTYNHRRSDIRTPSTTTADYLSNGIESVPIVDAFSIAPRIEWRLGQQWTFTASGTYGESKTGVESHLFAGGSPSLRVNVNYRDALKAGEVGLEGKVIALPGGDVRIAAGTGYRSNSLDVYNTLTSGSATSVTSDFGSSRDSYFAYGELNVPLVSRQMGIPGIDRMSISGALRYEDYIHVDRVATPKIGFVYAPISGLTLKTSWGRSFKAPTLYQQFQAKIVNLRTVTSYGASGYPAGATVIQMNGGNPDSLKPERANTWTITLAAEPKAVPGLSIEASYFRIGYSGRVIEPVQSRLGLLANPLYQSLITFNPSASQIAAAIAGAPQGLTNQTTTPYNAANVIAIVDARQRNSARQDIQGADLSLRYKLETGALGKFSLIGTATYLESTQVLVAGLPSYNLAGTIFDPPHWRWRAGSIWERGSFSGSLFLNRVDGVIDDRLATTVPVGGMTTLDAAASVSIQRGPLSGFDFSISAQNLTNSKPATIRNNSSIDPTWDSVNYSAIGRTINFMLSKRF